MTLLTQVTPRKLIGVNEELFTVGRFAPRQVTFKRPLPQSLKTGQRGFVDLGLLHKGCFLANLRCFLVVWSKIQKPTIKSSGVFRIVFDPGITPGKR